MPQRMLHVPCTLMSDTCLSHVCAANSLYLVRTCALDQLLQLQEILSSLLDACSYGTGALAKLRALLDVCMYLHCG